VLIENEEGKINCGIYQHHLQVLPLPLPILPYASRIMDKKF
jgi:hypothetical protein